jgi:3,4-dihydroxy 2-butanone 4-phosphate synthase
MTSELTDIDEAVRRFAAGGMVLLLDDPGREGEADLLQAAQFCTGESLNFMIKHARGLITLALDAERLKELELPLIEPRYAPPHAPRFAVPVDYTPATTTGVSAYDRAATIRAFLDPEAKPEHFARPGHVFPLAASAGGPQARGGHTEGAIGLAKLAGLEAAVVMCELMDEDGRMATHDKARAFAQEHGMPLVTVAQVTEALDRRAA